MLYWGIILFICIIVCVVSLKAFNKSCWDRYSKLEAEGELKTWRT